MKKAVNVSLKNNCNANKFLSKVNIIFLNINAQKTTKLAKNQFFLLTGVLAKDLFSFPKKKSLFLSVIFEYRLFKALLHKS